MHAHIGKGDVILKRAIISFILAAALITVCTGSAFADVHAAAVLQHAYRLPASVLSSAVNDGYMKISSKNRNRAVFVRGCTSLRGFSQTEQYFYLPRKAIPGFVRKLKRHKISEIKRYLLGLLPYIGAALTGAAIVSNCITDRKIKELKSLYRKNKRACYYTIRSSYGFLSYVREWNGITVKGRDCRKNGVTYKVKKMVYGRKY